MNALAGVRVPKGWKGHTVGHPPDMGATPLHSAPNILRISSARKDEFKGKTTKVEITLII